jgi:hypothetical protein
MTLVRRTNGCFTPAHGSLPPRCHRAQSQRPIGLTGDTHPAVLRAGQGYGTTPWNGTTPWTTPWIVPDFTDGTDKKGGFAIREAAW